MFTKGPMPGYSPKNDAKSFLPHAVCEKKYASHGISGYIVYPSAADAKSDTNALSSASTSREAWEKALSKVAVYNRVSGAWEPRQSEV